MGRLHLGHLGVGGCIILKCVLKTKGYDDVVDWIRMPQDRAK